MTKGARACMRILMVVATTDVCGVSDTERGRNELVGENGSGGEHLTMRAMIKGMQ
jgi:hypothetical protein